jgi:hypothetical protein
MAGELRSRPCEGLGGGPVGKEIQAYPAGVDIGGGKGGDILR